MHREIDIDRWNRKAAFEMFSGYDDPFFNLTANIEVSRLYDFCKSNGLAFSLAALHVSMSAANEIREFRLRLAEGKVIEFDTIHATQTILDDDETFSFCYFEWQPDIFQFDRSGRATREKYKILKTFDVQSDRLDLIYYSVIPWVSFTSFKHASRGDRMQSVPRIVFGRMSGDQVIGRHMPLSVEVNHALVDGFHVGKYYQLLQAKLDSVGR